MGLNTPTTPYGEAHHYARAPPGKVATGRSVQRSAKAREVERVNAILAKKLQDLKREAPSRFHAPDGAASLRPKPPGRRTVGASSSSASSASTSSYGDGAAARAWPVKKAPSTRVKDEERRIREGNAVLQRALAEQYKSGRESQLVAEGKGRPVDGLEMWRKRLAGGGI